MVHDKKNSQDVRQIFRRIAPHYNLVNCLMTGGQDKHWRQEVITLACLSLAEQMAMIGFHQVAYRRRMFGAIAIHWGKNDTLNSIHSISFCLEALYQEQSKY
jgi:ubiquinone/menaquinone biosynthesis C-methylase UbiE